MRKMYSTLAMLFFCNLIFAQNPQMLKDIFPGNNTGTIQRIVKTTNYTFFNQDDDDADSDRSLFRTDGTNAGTIKLNLTYPGYLSTKAELLTALGNKVVFAGDNFTNYGEIWASDGTQAGTVALERFQPNSNRIPVVEINTMGSYAYYSVINKDAGNVNRAYLRRTDGTAAGTSLVYDFSAFTGVPQVVFLTPVNNILYFIVYDQFGTGQDQLWRSDGTNAGTYLVYDFGSADFVESFLMPAGNNFYIMIASFVGGIRQNTIWKSDGTTAGTVPVKLIGTGNTNAYPPFATIGSTLYFAGVDGNGKELWQTDGTAAGTFRVTDINPGAGNANPLSLTTLNGDLYFSASNPTSGGELWKYSGGVASMVKDINPGAPGGGPGGLVVSNNTIIFSANNGVNGTELWITDGTAANTAMITDINPGAANSVPNTLTPGNPVYFAANNGVNGFEVFRYDNNGSAIENPHKFYVNDNSLTGDQLTLAVGNNTNNGSRAFPFATISYAVTQVTEGDTIYVDAGTYAEQVTIDKGVTIIGAGQNLTSIINPGSPLVAPPGPFQEKALIQTVQNIGDVNISNLQTTNAPANDGHSILLQTGGSVKNCRIIDGGLGVYVRVETGTKTVVVENNFIQASVFAVACQGSGLTATILNNTLNVTNQGFSVGIWVGIDFGPIVKLTATGNSINNYVYRGIVGNSYNTELRENSILGTGQYAIENTASLAVATCNWYGTSDQYAVAAKMNGNINFSPWLINSTDNDPLSIGFQPVPGSCGGRQLFCVNDNSLTGDIYTSAVGNNANNGSFSAPLATIAAALAKAQAGDFILVDAGSYTEIVNITKNITILGAGKGVTILNGPAGPVTPFPNTGETGIIQTANGLTDVFIENLTVDGTFSEEQHGIFIQGGGRVQNCELRYVNDGFYFQYISAQPRTAAGYNNYVHHVNFVGALFAGNGMTAISNNNVIDLTGAQYGIGFIAGYGGGGNVESFTASNNSIINFNGFGIMVGSTQVAQIHNNSITRLAGNFIQNVHTTNVDASCNWFGTAAAETIIPNVTGPVTYGPWLIDGTDISPAFGFQNSGTCPVANSFYVNDNSQAGDVFTTAIGSDANTGAFNSPFATLSYALGQVPVGATIYVDAGTYTTTNLNINKSITILGSNYNASPNNPANRLAINPVRNSEAMITGSTFTISSNDVRLEGLSFNPGAFKSQVTMASTGVNNFTFKRNHSKITSGQLLVLIGTTTAAGQTPAFGNYLIEDNRFESLATALGSSYIGVGNLNGITVNNNTFLDPAAIPQRFVSNSLASGIVANYIYSNNISYGSRNEWFSSSNGIASAIIENNISLHGQRSLIIQVGGTTASDIQVRSNYIENDFAELSPIQYSRSGTTSAGVPVNILIENNTIIQNATGRTTVPAGILAQNFTTGSIPTATIRRNKISFNGDYVTFPSSSVLGVSFTGNWQNINVVENEIAFNGTNLTNVVPASGQSSSGISISSDNGASTISASAVVNITGNKINGFRNSIAVYDASSLAPNTYVGHGNLPVGVNATINNNSFTGDVISINNGAVGQGVIATCNWYGSAAEQDVLSKVTSTVQHIPWLTNGTDNDVAVGFQPVAGACNGYPRKLYVNNSIPAGEVDVFTLAPGSNTNPGTQTLPFATLDFALSVAKAGDSIFVDAGIYNMSDFTINKAVTILGSKYLISPNDPSNKWDANPLRIDELQESRINGATITLASSNISLQGIFFDPGAKIAMALNFNQPVDNDFSNISLFKNKFKINSTSSQIIFIGKAATSPATIISSGYTVTDNRFEKVTNAGGFVFSVHNTKDVDILDNTFRLLVTNTATTNRTQNIAGFANGSVVDDVTFSNNVIDRANAVISSGRLAGLVFSGNKLYNCNGVFNTTNDLPESVSLDINNNLIESTGGNATFIRLVRTNGGAAGASTMFKVENNTFNCVATPGAASLFGNINYSANSSVLNPSFIVRSNTFNYTGDFVNVEGQFVRAITMAGKLSNVTIEKNEITLNGTNLQPKNPANILPVSPAISLYTDNGPASFIPTGAVINILNNKVHGFKHSVVVFDPGNGSNPYVGFGNLGPNITVNINYNSFTGDSVSINNGTMSNPVQATCNWYGYTAVQDLINKVSIETGNFVPWLTNGTDDEPLTRGFQPVAGSCNGQPLQVKLDGYTNVTCNGAGNGTISITVLNGVPPYQFAWTKDGNPYAITEDLTGLAPGVYSLTMLDALGTNVMLDENGDFLTVEVEITEPDVLTALASGTNNLCFGESNGTASVLVSGGTISYTYLWSNGATTESIEDLAAGVYSVTVTDANGCTTTAQYEVTQPTLLTAVAIGTSTTCANSATVNASGGAGSYTYLWSNYATTRSITSLPAGTYTVTVTDGNGCQTTASCTVTAGEAFNPSASSVNVSCFGGNNGSITLTNANATAPFEFSLDGVNFTLPQPSLPYTFNNLTAGTYTVYVRDVNGCTGFVTKTITQPPVLTATLGTIQSTCFGQNTGSISVTVTGGSGGLNYSWTNLSGYTSTQKNISGLAAGTYYFTVTDANGCSKQLTATVPSFAQITVTPTVTNIACKGEINGSISLNVTGGTASGFTYAWNTGSTSNSISNLGVGNYNVTITDIGSGCVVSRSYTITQPAANVNLSTGKTNATGCNSLGTITATGSGGTAPYTYSLNGGAYQSSGSFTGLFAGNYTVTVKDANGCTKTSAVLGITDSGSDEFEGNNSKNQAKAINLSVINSARIAIAGDAADWFKFTTTSAGSYTLLLTHPSASFTYNMYATGNNTPALVPTSTTGTTKTYALAASTTYYVSVTGGLSYVCYQFSVSPTSLLTKSSGNSGQQEVDKQPKTNDVFNVSAFPNPSGSYFNIKIETSKDEKTNLRVMDITGKLIEERKNLSSNQIVRLGDRYINGVYLVEVIQGTNRKTLRLVKM